jgi:hypothetical protein
VRTLDEIVRTGRFVVQAPFGIACYEVTTIEDHKVTGKHVGLVGTEAEAEAWVNKSEIVRPLRIF